MSTLDLVGMSLRIPTREGPRTVVARVSLRIDAGEAVGLVGESGSGKSMTARSVLRLVPDRAVIGGTVAFEQRSVLAMSTAELRAYRRQDVAMVFQDPRAHINPVRRIGDFMTEALRMDRRRAARGAKTRALDLLDEVGIAEPRRVFRQYPFELSGGMLQRVMIATALMADPKLLIADEPTTALDVTTQSEVMGLLGELRRQRELAMLFITHDLELAAATCDHIAVMYAGRIVETRGATDLHGTARHPYTQGLLAARPDIDVPARRLHVIPGQSVAAFEAPEGCPFAPRCPLVEDGCRSWDPGLLDAPGGTVACRRAVEPVGAPAQTEQAT